MGKRHSRILVVVCGNAGHGKDSLADAMAALTERGAPGCVERDAFAAPLKVCVHLKTGIPMWVLNGSKEIKEDIKYGAYGKTPRVLMQEEGEGARQGIAKTVWMDRAADRFLANGSRITIISDGRHPEEEMAQLRDRVQDRALVVFVRARRPDMPVNKDHISEQRIADISDDVFDIVAANDRSREDWVENVAPQVLYALILWAQTGTKKRKRCWRVICPRNPNPWPFETEEDAGVVAKGCACRQSDGHEVKPVDFDRLIFP